MSQQSRRELVETMRDKYLRAGRAERTRMLDYLVEVTGFHRKHANRVLVHGYQQKRDRRGRKPVYTGSVVSALATIWKICGRICGKRLQPFLPEMVTVLERHNELVLDEQTKRLLLQMSAATIDRKLSGFRQPQGRGLSTTKPGTLLKQSIPVRTFADWEDAVPGFLEVDLVAHCGDSAEGLFLYTMTATDVATGWTECMVLSQRSQRAVAAAMVQLATRLPFPLLGIDCDNDSAFINGTLKRHCEQHQITFTRSRAYKKNDQAFVEQKNGAVVRTNIGYRRYSSNEAAEVLAAIYDDLHAYVNFFQPVRKLLFKKRRGAKVYKRYDLAQTPCQRAWMSTDVTPLTKAKLSLAYKQMNPAALRRHIDDKLQQLWLLRE